MVIDQIKLLHKSVCLLFGLSLYRALVAQFIRIPQHDVIKFTIVSLKKGDKFKNLWPKYPERRHIRIVDYSEMTSFRTYIGTIKKSF